MPGARMGRLLGIAVIVSGLVGGVVGFAVSDLAPRASGTLSPTQPPQTREVWLFTVVLPFNDSRSGFPAHDYFAPDRIIVNKGDTVLIHFFNTEDAPEDHTFTMDAPYARNVIVHYGETTNITFVANVAGIFPYRCVYHQPSMTGWLVVLQ